MQSVRATRAHARERERGVTVAKDAPEFVPGSMKGLMDGGSQQMQAIGEQADYVCPRRVNGLLSIPYRSRNAGHDLGSN